MKKHFMSLLTILLISLLYGCEEDQESNVDLAVKDYDGNLYKTVQIGEQIWMEENLKTTHYADGTLIPLVEDGTAWHYLEYTDKAMCFYNNSNANKSTYGALYTWAAAMNGNASSTSNPSEVQGVCPDGWHLPSDDEWKELEIYLGMSQADADFAGYRGANIGSKLAGNSSLWIGDSLVNNPYFETSGFNVFPGGKRSSSGMANYLGYGAYFWSASEYDSSRVWYRYLGYNYSVVLRYYNVYKDEGFSVRCIQD